ncbi:hypothetical protein ABC502_10555 [Alkalimonas sp. NCh-2]|uniref:hypothetical protein n=1 Tax=Alkalimonas sp. NCh-2 TaxID=3144846 RepID=UPI0031F70250
MQELTFDQVEEVSGGSRIKREPREPQYVQEHQRNDCGGDSGGVGGATIASTGFGATNLAGSGVVAYALGGVPGMIVGGLGVLTNFAFGLTQEGRDGMRVQNHPATRHLYDCNGNRIRN